MTRSVKSSGCFLERASSDDPNHNHARDKARSLRERGLARNSAPSSQTPRPHRGVVTILAGLAPFIIHPDDFRVALPIGTKFDPVEMWRGRGFALDRATAPLEDIRCKTIKVAVSGCRSARTLRRVLGATSLLFHSRELNFGLSSPHVRCEFARDRRGAFGKQSI